MTGRRDFLRRIKNYFTYGEPWWSKAGFTSGRSITDLPISKVFTIAMILPEGSGHFGEYACLLFYIILFSYYRGCSFLTNSMNTKGSKIISRKGWFFGILALTFLVDVWDTSLKGKEYASALGVEYIVRTITYPILCLAAMS
jgi:hypothetical protein